MTAEPDGPTPGSIAISTRQTGDHVSLVGFKGVIVAVVKCAQGHKIANAVRPAKGWNSLDRHIRYIADLEYALSTLLTAQAMPADDPARESTLTVATGAAKMILAGGEFRKHVDAEDPPIRVVSKMPKRAPAILRSNP